MRHESLLQQHELREYTSLIGVFGLINMMTTILKSGCPGSWTYGSKGQLITFDFLCPELLPPFTYSFSIRSPLTPHPLFSCHFNAPLVYSPLGFLLNQHVLQLNEGKHTPLPFLWPPVALQHEREGWGLEVAVTSFLVCATCSKFATKCLSSVELTGEKWALSEPWPGCHEMTGIIGIHFKQPRAILLKCHIPTLKQTRRNPLW